MELTLEQHIIHQLLLRSGLDKDIGLYHGKMGIILFFVHYFKQTGQQIYEDTAGELMVNLQKEINSALPVGFANGLSGIGWGIEYLIQNGFSNNDSLEICEEIDRIIMEKDPLRMTDYTLDNGLEGIMHYVLAHIKGVWSQHAILPFDEMYLSDLFQAVKNISQDIELSNNFIQLSSDYSTFYENRTEWNYSFQLSSILENVEIKNNKLNSFTLGLKKGLSGYLLKKIYEN